MNGRQVHDDDDAGLGRRCRSRNDSAVGAYLIAPPICDKDPRHKSFRSVRGMHF